MRKIISRLVLIVLVVSAVGIVLFPVHAQDTMGDKIACDADLILSLYTAVSNFNYAAVEHKVMTAMPDMAMVDPAKLDYGQYAPLFNAMTSMMDDTMMSPGSTMDETMMTGMVGMMSMSVEDMTASMMAAAPAGTDMPEMTMLPAGDIPDEPAECTALRANLRQFYIALAYEHLMTSMMETPAS